MAKVQAALLGENLFKRIWPNGSWENLTSEGRSDYVRAACGLYNMGYNDALLPFRVMMDGAAGLFLDGRIVVHTEEVPGGS